MQQANDSAAADEASDYSGIPLMPGEARRIIVRLLQQQKQWQRKELASEVERIHLQRGGAKGAQSALANIKKALRDLAEDGLVENVGYGIWRSTALAAETQPTSDGETLVPDQIVDTEVVEELVAEKTIGHGVEAVYVYFNPNDRELAQLRGRNIWECKIGRSASGSPVDRIIGEGAKTALSHLPVIGLVIRTDDSGALEKALHASLRLVEQRVVDSPGAEWFYSSPSRIEEWHEAYQRAVAYLKKDATGEPLERPESDSEASS